MFGTWNPIAHVVILQLIVAFIYLVWPALRNGLIAMSKWMPESWFQVEDDDAVFTRARGTFRGKWRDAAYQRAGQSEHTDWREQTRARATARDTSDPLKAQHLRVLGLSEPVHLIDIKSAYRRLAKTYHPDRYAADNYSDTARDAASEKMREVNAAYDWLCANF